MSAKEDRPARAGGSTRSEAAVAAVMLAAIVLPSVVQVAFRRAPAPPAIERADEHRYDLKIDVNACNRLELEHLPGIGPKLAERIIQSRDANGPFAHPRDLMRVKGIGQKMYAKMAPYLVFPDGEEPPGVSQ
jgi:competence ComEA-like helix-hairpin-helix protein